jgi:hypothetical protein
MIRGVSRWSRKLLGAGLVCLVLDATAGEKLLLSWTNNLLTISGAVLPDGKLDIWYLEAFCRPGAAQQKWDKTVIPHKTKLVSATPQHLRFHTTVGPAVGVNHEVRAGEDEVELRFEFKNDGTEAVPIQWFQPACIRVDRFTGCGQSNYTARSFIFTERGLMTLDKTRRTEDALYRGGQVYVPAGINLSDANPRPICRDQPTNGLIGCFSADGKMLLATASDSTHELFEGVYVCLHSDPRVGGLAAGESKTVRAKIYFLPNDTEALVKRYHKDFTTGVTQSRARQ